MAVQNGNKIRLVVVTPYTTFFEDKVDIISIPSVDGEIGIMFGHSPLVAAITPGVCRIVNNGETKHFSCAEGYAEIGHHVALIVCNSAEWPDDISIPRIVKAYKDASAKLEEEKAMKSEQGIELTSDTLNMLKRAKARMHLIELAGTQAQRSRLEEWKRNGNVE